MRTVKAGFPIPEEVIGTAVQEIRIQAAMIRLGQLLKLGGVVASGAGGKQLLAGGAVLVNGAVETRRGRQLHDGDVVAVGEWELRVSARPADRPSGPIRS